MPWEVQTINTCPDNFLWEKGKPSLISVAPGLYAISFGFYAKKEPTVHLYLNGEPLMATQREKKVATYKHPAGNVNGLTMVEFFALPARARLAVVFQGDAYGEGFFSIRKL